ncbi:universal stress protein [Polaribacter butkevichii]|uniref:Universal stress protein UspA n=1 Tax=Polaribacter butkevichii TaxID=218490 RepID=A0A2P6CAS9_9FLAO|nr:universal stress protein [Polaribacter butkevichii]PQJ72027.1 universal stress protein UspA [Polaribacter butkevichii]
MKNIIVPVDFSIHSEYALKTASLLAKKHDATLYALHMLDLQDVYLSESENYQQEQAIFFLKLAEKKFKDFLKKDYLEDVKVVPIIKRFKVFSEVNIIAEEVKADLVIIGSHGATGLKDFFVGSNTEKVVRYSKAPVLVVKNELLNVDFADIVVATDFSEESIPAFKDLLKALDFLNARKHILYVNLPNEEFKTTSEMALLANNFLMKAEGNVDRMINVNYVCDRTIEKGILNFSNAVGADLISVITHGRKGLSHIFAGSITEDIANHSTLPIMTIKI